MDDAVAKARETIAWATLFHEERNWQKPEDIRRFVAQGGSWAARFADALKLADAILAALSPATGRAEGEIPNGWKLVPIVPTTEMRRAMAQACTLGWDIGDHTWDMGLKYSPKPPAGRTALSARQRGDEA